MRKDHVSPNVSALLYILLAYRLPLARSQQLQWDPETELPCAMWHDNGYDEEMSCEEVREYWTITPEQFTAWNPSVGLDCKPWRAPQSYCVVPVSRLPTTTSSSEVVESTTTTTSSSTLGPSPTWDALGCYEDEDADLPVMEKVMEDDGGITIEECQHKCYRNFFEFAGLKGGDQCLCSSFVGGEWANSTDECDAPCSGDEDEICGGENRINAYQAEDTFDWGDDDHDTPEEEEDSDSQAKEDKDADDSEEKDNDQGNDESEEAATGEDSESSATRYRAFFGIT